MAEQQEATMPHIDADNVSMLQAIGALVGTKPVYEYSIPEQRELFTKMQSQRPKNPGVAVSEHSIHTSHGDVKTFLYKPENAKEDLPFIFYVHGGGWIFGSAVDFESFLFDLVMLTGLAIIFPEYTLAPEKKYPTQLEQCIEVFQDVLKHGKDVGLSVNKVAVGADSVGCTFVACLIHEFDGLITSQVKSLPQYPS
jgi:acetyl esterase/lipase